MDAKNKATAIQKALPFIKNSESYRFKAYKNAPDEPWTVGWGFTYDEHGHPFTSTSTMDRDRADRFLVQMTNQRADAILKDVGATPLTANQLAALISLHHNIGPGNWSRSTVLRMLRSSRSDKYARAADAFLLWKRGNTADDLLPRRGKERRLFLT